MQRDPTGVVPRTIINQLDMWHVSNSCGGGFEIPFHKLLIDFIAQITDHCKDPKIWVESF